MANNDGGQFCLDKNGAIFVRYGADILKISAMVEFDDMIVCGCGMAGGASYPNLLFLDKTRYQEKGIIAAGTAADNAIKSEWTSKVYGLESDKLKKLARVEIKYYNDHTYQSGISSGFSFYYRVDSAVGSSTDNVTGAYLPAWTEIISVSTLMSATTTDRDRTHLTREPIELDLEGRTWQFQITSDYDFMILGFEPFLLPTKEMEDI